MKEIVLIGAGAHAREIAGVFDAHNDVQSTYEVLGYVVEAAYGQAGQNIDERKILGDFDWLASHASVEAVCAVGAPELRLRLVRKSEEFALRFATAVHPSAVVGKRVDVGEGSLIQAGCVLTNDVRVGKHVHVNIGCTISHDCVLDDFSTLAPGVHAAGGVIFGEGCNVGVGAAIAPRQRVGAWSVVGAGSVVIDDVPANSVVAGSPARVLRVNPEGWQLRP